jgi:radical SAM protein with 4Fe4S-binding SPASM domain
MKNSFDELIVLDKDEDIIIFNPKTRAWYYTTLYGLELLKSHCNNNTESTVTDSEEKLFLEDIIETLFSKEKSVNNSVDSYGVTIHITRNCNMNCSHCRAFVKINDDDLSLGVIKKFVYLSIESGSTSFTITGGEPLTKWDKTESTLRYIRSQKPDALIQLMTNGSLMDISKAEVLFELGVSIQVSLDTVDPVAFKDFRGLSISSVISGIRNLIKSGLEVCVSSTLTKINYLKIDNLIDFCIKEKISALHFPLLEKGGKGHENWESLALSDEETISVLGLLMDKYFKKGLRNKLLIYNFESAIEKIIYIQNLSVCKCGHGTSALYPDGKVYYCSNLAGNQQYCFGKIEETGQNSFVNKRKEVNLPKFFEIDQCKECDVAWLCIGGCKDRVNLFYGNMNSPDPWCNVLKWWFKEMIFITADLMEQNILKRPQEYRS